MSVVTEPSIDHEEPDVIPRPIAIIGIATGAGVAIELSTHNWLIDGQPAGVGTAIALIVTAFAVVRGAQVAGHSVSAPALHRYGAAMGFAVLVCFRASPVLATINLSCSLALLSTAVALHHRDSAQLHTLTEFARTGKDIAVHGAFGAVVVLGKDLPARQSSKSWETIRRVFVGAAIAFPLLLVFGALFASADAVFGDSIGRVAGFELSDGASRGIALATVATWVLVGLVRRAATAPKPRRATSRSRQLGATEALTIMTLVNGLFAVFVGFQVFEVVASYQSADVGYAQQARNGFFQLVAVATMVVAVVLLIDWWANLDAIGKKRLRSHNLALIGLTAAVLASAVVRMGLYVQAYGLTELRFYTSAFMIWIGFLLVWLTRTVLAGHRQRFAAPALSVLLAISVTLSLVNPDSTIASYNMNSQARLGPAIDTAYLVSALSADAVPAILDRIESVGDPCAQLDFVDRLHVAPAADIRSWNYARSAANDSIAAMRTSLEGSCQS